MNEQDKQAFVAWKIEQFKKGEPRLVPSEAWQAALEYARGQQEPVRYECRMRPLWIDRQPFTKWEECTQGTFEDYKRVPRNGDWEFESRALYTHPAQPVQPAGVQGEPVDLRELFERLLFGTYAGKDSYYNEEQIKHGCFERAQELVDVAKRMNIALYIEPPAVAINEQLLEALRSFPGFLSPDSEHWPFMLKRQAAIAAAEAAKGSA